MKKYYRFLAATIAALILFTLSANALTELDLIKDERRVAMVCAEDNAFADTDTALLALKHIIGRDPDVAAVFEKAFVGFAAALTDSEIALVDASPLFFAYQSGSYSALDYTEEITLDEQIYTAAEMLSVPDRADSGAYTGRGVVVAVIDNGFDISHTAFSGSAESPRLTKALYSDPYIAKELNADVTKELYVSEKLPFVYNYTTSGTDVFTLNNHGTHVAAAIGGRDSVITGIAPDTQLLLMKVFDDSGAAAAEYYVMQALEDAITLGADVINMSIGTYSGFSEDGMTLMGRAARNLEKAGISVVCAAGNDGTIGSKSYFNRLYGIDMPLSSHTDYGTLSYPATMTDYIAVASANNLKIAYNTLIHIENGTLTRINYTDTNSALGIIKSSFFAHFSGKTLEYVPVPGPGKPEDFSGLDLTGRLALIERGEITFAEKANNATAAGAVGAVIYDNVNEEEMTYMELSGCKIPAVFISKADGELLINSSVHELSFDTKLSDFTDNPNAYRLSDFSSWGVTPELKLKPDVTSVGERVYSAASGGNYSSLSGTSMATPLISGTIALLCEKLNAENSSFIASKRPDYIKTVLMNSATPLINPDTGAEYSPRAQGAGLVDFKAAASLPVTVTDAGKSPSASLGNKLGEKFEIRAKITNTSVSSIDLSVSACVLTDSKLDISFGPVVGVKGFNSLTSLPLENAVVTVGSRSVNINRYSDDRGEETLTVKPGQTRDLIIKVDISADKARLDGDFEHGFFADGFVYLEADGFTCSLPFTGFVGDFYSSPALDTTVLEPHFLYGNLLASKADAKLSVLGSRDLTINGKISAELCAFSPDKNGKFDTLCFAPSLVRNVRGFDIAVTDNSTGKTVWEDSISAKMPKSETSPTSIITVWDGGDGINPDFVFPDGDYTVTVSAKLQNGAYGGEVSLPVSIDTTAPSLKAARALSNNGKLTLELEAEDNIGVREVTVYTDGNTTVSDTDDGDGVFTFDITSLSGNTVWADITDYAMNTKTVMALTLEEAGK